MKVGDRITLDKEGFKHWPELKGKKLIIWHTEPGFIYIKIGRKKDYHAWDENWFIYE